jgi:MFS family permease
MTELASQRRRALAGATIGNMVGLTPAVGAVFGLFLMPLAETFGWKRAAISGVLGLISIGPALVAPLAGSLADRIGARRILIIGNICFAISVALLSLTTNSLVQFYLTFALVAGSAAFVSTPLLAKVVSDWYDTGRGTALGFAAGFGNGFGSTIIPIAAACVMVHGGWRNAYLTVAVLVLALGMPAYILLIRDRRGGALVVDEAVRDGLTLREASRTYVFWLIVCAIAAAAGSMTAIFSHMVPILAERGIGVATATMALAIFALGTAAWQVFGGVILDRISTPRIIVPMYLASVAGIVLLEWGRGTAMLIAAACLLAVGLGTQFSALPYVLGRYFGLRHFGSIMGAAYSAVFVLQGLVPILLDHFYDVQQTYGFALAVISGCVAIGGLSLLLLPPYRYGMEDAPIVVLHA